MANKFDKILGEYREDDCPYIVENGLNLELWFKSQLLQVWATVPAAPPATGTPMGAWLPFYRTYP